MGDSGFPSLPAHSTVELRLLGRVSARVEAGREAAALLAQPKRVALLGYLAAATPRGFHRRDTLLALFWPEADQEHARASLRKSVHFLRQQLGPGAILSRGDEEIGLDLDRCWCDVVAFEKAIETGEWERAAELYQGDLLPGLHLSDVPEFERWLEETRGSLRGQALRAARQLTESACAQGRISEGVRWARRAIELSPYDEDGIRRLLTLLIKSGDRAGALLTYEQFARRLSMDLELEPSADTAALMESARNQKDLPSPEAPTVPNRGLERTIPVRRRARLVLAGLAMLEVAAVIGSWVWAHRSQAAPRAATSAGAIAILPFEYRGEAELSYLAEGMVELLSTKLDGAPGLRTVDPYSLLTFVSRDRGGSDLERGRRAAEHFGAHRFVLGNIVEAGARLAVSATVYDVERGPQGSVEASAANASQIFDVADQLARHILSEVQDKPLELARIADQGTSSLPALKAYIEGEREFRYGHWGKAGDALQRAIQLDTGFALAHYRLSFFASDLKSAQKHLDQAQRQGGRLSEHQRELIEATSAFSRGDFKEAERLYRQVLSAHPDDLEAWLMLGAMIGSWGPLNGYAWVDAREPFEQVLKLDPRNANALWQLAAFAARDRRVADLDSFTERFLQLHPEPRDSGNAEGQRAIVRGDNAGVERFIADLRSRPDLPAQTGAGSVTWTTMDLVAGRRLWGLITEPNRPAGMRVLARATLAKLELTNGRWRAASAQFDSAARLDAGTVLEHRIYYALTYFLKPPRSQLVTLRDSLERWEPAKASQTKGGLAEAHRSVQPYLKAYLLGMLDARLGEDGRALRYASELERADSSSPEGGFAWDQAKVLRAEVAWRAGRAEEALATLEQARFWTTHRELDFSGDSPFFIHLHERFARAELLYQLGRMDEAMRWYRVFTYDLLYTAPSHYRLAQIYLARGDTVAAREHYARFVETWRSSDPELRPRLQEAELALARLH